MELRVWTDRVERVIVNADEETTCSDVIFTLAAITKITGCYTLIGQHEDNYMEFLLAPSDKPLKLLKERKERGQSSLRFLLHHSKRTQPITQVNYHVRQRNRSERSTDIFLYNREAFRRKVPHLSRRHTAICVPSEWRKPIKKRILFQKMQTKTLMKNSEFSKVSNSEKEQSNQNLNKTITNLIDPVKYNALHDNNNNKNSGDENKSNQVELVLYLTEANIYSHNRPKGITSKPNTFQTKTTSITETVKKPIKNNIETIKLNQELNSIFNSNKKLSTQQSSKEIKEININQNSNDGKYITDSLDKIVLENSFVESDMMLNRTNKTIHLPSKLLTSNQQSLAEPSLNKTFFEVIESLDDYLDKEGHLQSKKIPKKSIISTKTIQSKKGTDSELSYQEKLSKFKLIEKGEKSADNISTKLFNTNKCNNRVNELNNEYAEHVDSEIKDLKIEVEENEKAAKKLENSIKQMQTNLEEFYDETKSDVKIKERINNQIIRKENTENEIMDTYYYPSEQFSTLTKIRNGSLDSNEIEEPENEMKESAAGTDSLNEQFLFLLQDNRKGYLV